MKEVLDEIFRIKIKDPPLPMLAVTNIHLTGDLRQAKVYISAITGAADTERAVARLEKLKGYIRSVLGKEMHVRYTPEVQFLADDSIAEGSRILELMKEIEVDGEGRTADSEQTGGDDLP